MSWTGGQYSLARLVLGAVLIALFVSETAWSAAWIGLTVASCLLLAAGWRDRIWALVAAGTWLSLLVRRAVPLDPGSLSVVVVLAAHLFAPPAPYGAWSARGRDDPGGGWRMPPWIHGALWVCLIAGYAYTGVTKLIGGGMPYELLVVAPALWRRSRPWLWVGLAVAELVRVSPGGLLLLLFAFDPGWIGPRGPAGRETLFYDGQCGLCHRWVRFLLAEDTEGRAFRLAPLQGASLPPGLPDSLVLRRTDGPLLARSAAVLHILARLGGVWRLAGIGLAAVPRSVRDRLYDAVASVRHRWFARPETLCPVVPDHLHDRFE